MPEGYTHAHTALAAAGAADWHITSLPAFLAGANGPDMFFCYEIWHKGAERTYDLPAFGERLHGERTGAFLQALHRHALTPAQQDYFLGFLCHYGTDCVVHPYVIAMMKPGMPYAKKGGHGYFEIALDSALHKKTKGSGCVPVDDFSPRLKGAEMAQVAAQVRRAVWDVFAFDLPAEAVAIAFDQNHAIRRLFVSRFHIKYALCWLIEPLVFGRGFITGHLSPQTLYGEGRRDKKHGRALPARWENPYTGESCEGDVWQLLGAAEALCGAMLRSVLDAGGMTLRGGALPAAESDAMRPVWQRIGSCDYVAGKETPLSRARALKT